MATAPLGFNHGEEFDAYGERITDVHIKDAPREGSVVFGSGDANIEGVFDRLRNMAFDGPLIMQAYRDDEGVAIFREQLKGIAPLLKEYFESNSGEVAMDLGLRDDAVFITGSSRGIGAESPGLFGRGRPGGDFGQKRRKPGAKRAELAAEFGGERVAAINADLSSEEAAQEAARRVAEAFGKLDHLVLNIGDGRSVSDPVSPVEHWNSVMDQNFNSAVSVTRACLTLLEARETSSILFVSSIVGCEAFGAPVDYSTAKAAINAFSKNLARKVAGSGVRVNTLAPGNVLFPGGSWDEKLWREPERFNALIESTVPMKRFGTVEEVADAALFLCSKRASFITGSLLKADGGKPSESEPRQTGDIHGKRNNGPVRPDGEKSSSSPAGPACSAASTARPWRPAGRFQ